VAWSGVDAVGIISLRDSCEAREAQQVLWLGEGCAKRFSFSFNPASIRSRLLPPRTSPLSPSFHTSHPSPGVSCIRFDHAGFVGFRFEDLLKGGVAAQREPARAVAARAREEGW
jgi:hypothetical protein